MTLGRKEMVLLLACAAAMGLGALSIARTGARDPSVGEGFSRECGERLGLLVARCLERGSRVVVVSGELKGANSVHRRAEVDGLESELDRAGIKILDVARPSAGSRDLDPETGGASGEFLLEVARRHARADAVISLAGLPARAPAGLRDAFGRTQLFAYEQHPQAAARWAESEACGGLLVRVRGTELLERVRGRDFGNREPGERLP